MSDTNLSERVSKFVSSVRNRKSLKKNIPDRTNGDQYYYVHEFEQADEKLCINYDKRNEEIFQKNLKLYNEINKKLINTPFNIDKKPEPPKRPNNYERLHLWKKRNIKISAHNQTLAILYLMANNINIKLNDCDTGVEPYEAVNIAEKISIDKNENISNIVNSFVPTLNLNNDTFNKYKNNEYNIEYSISNNLSKSEPNLYNNNDNNNSSNNIYDSNNFVCSNPEHHNVNHKINQFNRNSFYPQIPLSFNLPPPPSCPQPSTVPSAPPSYNTNTSENINT